MQASLFADDELRVLRGHALRAGVHAELLARQAQRAPRRDTQIPISMTPRQREIHDALQLAIARLLGTGTLGRDDQLRLQRLLTQQRLVCNGVALAQFADYWRDLPSELSALHSPKLGALRELRASLVVQQARKVVVFSQWRRMLLLAERTTADVLGAIGSAYLTERSDSLLALATAPAAWPVRLLLTTPSSSATAA